MGALMSSPASADDLIDAIRCSVIWALERHEVGADQAVSTAAEVCREICRFWGGGEHWIPTTDRNGRNAAIVAAARAGEPLVTIAVRCGVSVRTAARVIRRQGAGLGRDEWVL